MGVLFSCAAPRVVGSVGKFNGPSGHPEPELVKTVSRRAAPEDNRRRSARRALPVGGRFFENVFENVR